MSAQPPPPDDVTDLLPKKPVAWGAIAIGIALILAAVGAFWLYSTIEQRGLSVRGDGHIVVLPDGSTWVALLDGSLIRATAESAQRLGARTGPCTEVAGSLLGRELELERLTCTPGQPLLRRIGERLQRMNLRFGYWDQTLEHTPEDDLEPHLRTIEVVASMVDKRFDADAPQLLALYTPLFAESLAEARQGKLPPPVLIQVKRNDFLIKRLARPEVAVLLARDRFILGAAAVKGGWLVRTVEIAADGPLSFERLLEAPEEAPWPTALVQRTIRASRFLPSTPVGIPPPARP